MNVAVLGWGSLIWRPDTLRIAGRWRRDGPHLPIEFARLSTGGRLTLVIHPEFDDQQTYWAISTFTILEDARSNLRHRERTRIDHVRSVSRSGRASASDAVTARVRDWLDEHATLDAAIWTGLPSTLLGPRASVVAQAVEYFTSLDRHSADYHSAREYVVKAPPQIQTIVRREMRDRGWADAELPTDLFE